MRRRNGLFRKLCELTHYFPPNSPNFSSFPWEKVHPWKIPVIQATRQNHRQWYFLVFQDNCQHQLKYILLLLQFNLKTLSAFTSQGFASSRLLPSMYWYTALLNRSAKILDIQASPRASTFVKNVFASRCSRHATTFAPHLLNHLR